MSTFRNSINARNGQQAYVLLGGTVTAVTITNVTADQVTLTLATPIGAATKLIVHIDTIQLLAS